ncbi:hypothetical protein J3A83DRAFT_3181410 [Scleroderma citrinum]
MYMLGSSRSAHIRTVQLRRTEVVGAAETSIWQFRGREINSLVRDSLRLGIACARRGSDSMMYSQAALSSFTWTNANAHRMDGLVDSAPPLHRQHVNYYPIDPSFPSLPPLNLGPSLRSGLIPDQPYVLPRIEISSDLDGIWSASILQKFEVAIIKENEENTDAPKPLEEAPSSPSVMDLPADGRSGDGQRMDSEVVPRSDDALRPRDERSEQHANDGAPQDAQSFYPPSKKPDTGLSPLGNRHLVNSHSADGAQASIPEPEASKIPQPRWKKLFTGMRNRKHHASPGGVFIATAIADVPLVVVPDGPTETRPVDYASSITAISVHHVGCSACCLSSKSRRS